MPDAHRHRAARRHNRRRAAIASVRTRVDAVVAHADPDATIVALPDADLGQRLAGSAANRGDLRAKLKARGVNALISGAFQPRGARKPRNFVISLTRH